MHQVSAFGSCGDGPAADTDKRRRLGSRGYVFSYGMFFHMVGLRMEARGVGCNAPGYLISLSRRQRSQDLRRNAVTVGSSAELLGVDATYGDCR